MSDGTMAATGAKRKITLRKAISFVVGVTLVVSIFRSLSIGSPTITRPGRP